MYNLQLGHIDVDQPCGVTGTAAVQAAHATIKVGCVASTNTDSAHTAVVAMTTGNGAHTCQTLESSRCCCNTAQHTPCAVTPPPLANKADCMPQLPLDNQDWQPNTTGNHLTPTLPQTPTHKHVASHNKPTEHHTPCV